ncbi:hypothetical protein [Reichenbachiella sp. MALMAid0571]|uniref:hypothetical protein n=1 Tax=Reichenbachiella sp. MALMAid0571 TaxID=3143939 RepID=UPI0032DE7D5F
MANENYFSNKMVNKTDSELQNYAYNKSKFQEEAVLAAIWELEKRKKAGEDIKNIESEIEQKQKDVDEAIKKELRDSNITDDPNAPILYHSKFVFFFGAFFSVFAGSILMALNFAQLDKKNTAWLVALSGLIYSAVQVITLNQIEKSTSGLALPISLLGMYILESVFWKKQVSSDLKFRKRSIWGAIIIGSICWIPFIYAIIVSDGL